MPQENLTEHALRGVRKAFQLQAERLELKERRRTRAVERANKPRQRPREREWWDAVEEETPSSDSAAHEGAQPGPSPSPPRNQQPGAVNHAASPVLSPHASVPNNGERRPPQSRGPSVETRLAGTVIEVQRGRYLVAAGDTTECVARLAGRLGPVSLVAGDRVLLDAAAAGPARIVEALPRRSVLARAAGPWAQQVLAANVDQAVVVCSPSMPPFRPGLIDRYLVAASRDRLTPVVCLNKFDLESGKEVERALDAFERLGVSVLRTSAATGQGIGDLRSALAGRTSVLTGHSGVGKSSLLNALVPGLGQRVGGVTGAAAGQGKGRHTTTSARLLPLPEPDTFIVDTPGIRTLGIQGIAPADLAVHFPDLAQLAPQCRFRGCLHAGEAGCGVDRAAREDPWLARRLASYRRLLEDLV